MILADLFFVVVIAAILTAFFAGGLRRPGPWGGWWWFFVMVVLAGFLAAAWSEPIGPRLGGVVWLPIVWMALLFALLLAAATPPRSRVDESTPTAGEAGTVAAVALGGFFWLLFMGLLVAVIVGYLM
jgi:hypothetical protein